MIMEKDIKNIIMEKDIKKYSDEEKQKVFQDFLEKFSKDQKEMPQDLAEFVNKNFWDLLY